MRALGVAVAAGIVWSATVVAALVLIGIVAGTQASFWLGVALGGVAGWAFQRHRERPLPVVEDTRVGR